MANVCFHEEAMKEESTHKKDFGNKSVSEVNAI